MVTFIIVLAVLLIISILGLLIFSKRESDANNRAYDAYINDQLSQLDKASSLNTQAQMKAVIEENGLNVTESATKPKVALVHNITERAPKRKKTLFDEHYVPADPIVLFIPTAEPVYDTPSFPVTEEVSETPFEFGGGDGGNGGAGGSWDTPSQSETNYATESSYGSDDNSYSDSTDTSSNND